MKKIIIVVLLVLVAAFAAYKYVYQSHRDIQKEEAAYTAEAITLAEEFGSDQKVATDKYLNQTIIVNGEVTEIEDNAVTLSEAVYATFSDATAINIKVGDHIKIKGRCIGYDELLEIIKLDQSNILE